MFDEVRRGMKEGEVTGKLQRSRETRDRKW